MSCEGCEGCEGCEEGAYVIDALAKLLAEIAIIVNGLPPSNISWSYHDLPEKVRALKQAQQPAAAVPEGYAAAIKAVQEMMPPRDFRPSAQVWLTGNQVNELHARLDAAAMLAAANKEKANEHC